MKKLVSILLLALVLVVPTSWAQDEGYHCGDSIRIEATPAAGYHFVEWSDGNTENPRLIAIDGDIELRAIFAPDCGTYAQVPVIQLYDWMLMLNRDTLQKQHYELSETDIRWYRVVGEADDLETFTGDDELVGEGFYLTLGEKLTGTGQYYAVIDVSRNMAQGALCSDYMRSEIVDYSAPSGDVPAIEVRKEIRKGLLYIIVNDETYNAAGIKIKEE